MQRCNDATDSSSHTLITPAAYARLLGLNRSTISRQIATGAIPTHDGKIDPEEADKARASNLSMSKRRNKPVPPENLDLILDLESAAFRKLFDEILSKRHLVPGILAAIGVKDPVLLHASDDVFAALVCDFAGDLNDVACDWGGYYDLPSVETPIKAVFAAYKIKLTKQVFKAADKMADAVYEAITAALRAEAIK